ncbi:hypothetical protein ACHAP5_000094 [Fusarium lateritium]
MHSALAAAPHPSGGYQHPDRRGLECRSREVITTIQLLNSAIVSGTVHLTHDAREEGQKENDDTLAMISTEHLDTWGFVIQGKYLSDGETGSLEGKGAVS